jgi:hypothetical protein
LYDDYRNRVAGAVAEYENIKSDDPRYVQVVQALRGKASKPLPLPGAKGTPSAAAATFASQRGEEEPGAEPKHQGPRFQLFRDGEPLNVYFHARTLDDAIPQATQYTDSRGIDPNTVELRPAQEPAQQEIRGASRDWIVYDPNNTAHEVRVDNMNPTEIVAHVHSLEDEHRLPRGTLRVRYADQPEQGGEQNNVGVRMNDDRLARDGDGEVRRFADVNAARDWIRQFNVLGVPVELDRIPPSELARRSISGGNEESFFYRFIDPDTRNVVGSYRLPSDGVALAYAQGVANRVNGTIQVISDGETIGDPVEPQELDEDGIAGEYYQGSGTGSTIGSDNNISPMGSGTNEDQYGGGFGGGSVAPVTDTTSPIHGYGEGKDDEADYDDDYQDTVRRVKQKAKELEHGSKTVWVPNPHGTGGRYKVVPDNKRDTEVTEEEMMEARLFAMKKAGYEIL